MSEHIDRFIEFFQSNGNTNGMKWDDLVVQFEWTIDYSKILASLESDPKLKSIVEKTGEILKYNFNSTTFENWKQSIDPQMGDDELSESFNSHV